MQIISAVENRISSNAVRSYFSFFIALLLSAKIGVCSLIIPIGRGNKLLCRIGSVRRIQAVANIIKHTVVVAAVADPQGIGCVKIGSRNVLQLKIDFSVFFAVADLLAVEGDIVLTVLKSSGLFTV